MVVLRTTKNEKVKYVMKKIIGVLFTLLMVAACSPEVGTEKWCKNMKEKPKGDWSVNEAKDYAKHCVLK
ncbi:DUF3012 domain-containing protein [Aliikangiella sp. IMCC44359]|uniref:DUF3012 domain-containing protein n=1 Tax=Aliikangiella sp. IMCC44359 TaxID=3459125 RepID=UPI00403AB2C3